MTGGFFGAAAGPSFLRTGLTYYLGTVFGETLVLGDVLGELYFENMGRPRGETLRSYFKIGYQLVFLPGSTLSMVDVVEVLKDIVFGADCGSGEGIFAGTGAGLNLSTTF